MLYINIFTFWQQNKTNNSILRNFLNQYFKASQHLSDVRSKSLLLKTLNIINQRELFKVKYSGNSKVDEKGDKDCKGKNFLLWG